MPGGSPAAWPHVKPIFQAIAAKVEDGTPCCDWVGDDGAGHFVKMVHNGIEYGDMQLICESYQIMKELLGMSADEMHEVFAEWNKRRPRQLPHRDHARHPGVQGRGRRRRSSTRSSTPPARRGPGSGPASTALDLGIPLTLISEAVYARCLSAMKDERVAASKILRGPDAEVHRRPARRSSPTSAHALYASKIVSYAQGYELMRAAAGEYKWDLTYGGIALLWRGGCIIRSTFLGKIKEAYDKNPKLSNLLLDPFFREQIEAAQDGVAPGGRDGGARTASGSRPRRPRSPTSTGSATGGCRRTCCRRSATTSARTSTSGSTSRAAQFFHTNWTGRGGTTASSAYVA